MRLIALLSLFILETGCAGTKNASAKPGRLNGTWVPISQEMGGTAFPKTVFEKEKLIMLDSTYTFTAESIDKGIVKCRDDKMDIYGRQGINAGKHFTAIYKMENGQLIICYNLSGDHYPENYETKGKPLYFLTVYKKMTP